MCDPNNRQKEEKYEISSLAPEMQEQDMFDAAEQDVANMNGEEFIYNWLIPRLMNLPENEREIAQNGILHIAQQAIDELNRASTNIQNAQQSEAQQSEAHQP